MFQHLKAPVAAFMTLAVLLFSGPVHATDDGLSSNPPALIESAAQPTPVDIVLRPKDEFIQHMTTVFNIGNEVGHPETLQAILLQETNGGRSDPVGNRNSPIGKRSYGLMQVQLVAAKSVLERYPDLMDKYFPGRKLKALADEEIIALLLTNDEANVRIAAYHFKLYLQLSKGDWNRAVAAYQLGIGGVQKVSNHAESPYVLSIKRHLKTAKTFNRNNSLVLTMR